MGYGFEETRDLLRDVLGESVNVAERPAMCDDHNSCAGHVYVTWREGESVPSVAARIVTETGGKYEPLNHMTGYVRTRDGVEVELRRRYSVQKVAEAYVRGTLAMLLSEKERETLYNIGLSALGGEVTPEEELAARLALDELDLGGEEDELTVFVYLEAHVPAAVVLQCIEMAAVTTRADA